MLLTFRRLLILLMVLNFFQLNAQRRPKAVFGELEASDLNVTSFPKDPEAAGVVLYERGRNYWRVIDGQRVRLIKEVHRKLKVFDASKFENATVYIPYYRGDNASEDINKFQAITHNGKLKNYVGENAIFDTDETTKWSIKRFTFPNIQDGSILEYTYQIETPFDFNFGGWEFQGNLPKLYTEFVSEIPGNYVYNRSLIGNETLDVNEVSLKKDCFFVPGHKINADCEVAVYAMKDVPAFKEEAFMLSKRNYLAKVSYELAQYTNFYGIKTKFAQDWDDVDKELRSSKELGRQLKLNYYFKDVIPESIKSVPNKLERAKAIYNFIQGHYAWNGSSPFFGDVNLKKAFEEKSGNVSEINLALINALEVAELDTKLVVLSTRSNGLPRQNYPVITDFNYVAALVNIDGKEYLLDATDRYLPFGVLPIRALNIQGRAMDFKEGSYWVPLLPETKNVHYVNVQMEVTETGSFSGKVSEINAGYLGVDRRRALDTLSQTAYLTEKQNANPNLEVSDMTIEDKTAIEKPVKERYTFSLEGDEINGNFFINPFFLNDFFSENPFKLDKRSYPVDFAYPFNNTYLLSIDLKDSFEPVELPENRVFKLAGEAGECSIIYSLANGKINLRYSLKLNEYRFGPDSYLDLKHFFDTVATMQTNETIALKKI